MNCRDVRDVLLDPGSELGEAVHDHLGSCPACAALAADDGALAGALGGAEDPVPDLSELQGSVGEAIRAEQGASAWLRSLPTSARMGLALGTGLLLVFVGGVVLPREDMQLYPTVRMGIVLSLLAGVGFLALVQRLRPLHAPPTNENLVHALLGFSLLLPILLAVLPAAHVNHVASTQGVGADLVPSAFRCLVYGTALALPLLVLLAALKRRLKPSRSVRLLAAAVAALLGNLVLQLHCPITMPVHLLAGHASLALLFAAVVWPPRS